MSRTLPLELVWESYYRRGFQAGLARRIEIGSRLPLRESGRSGRGESVRRAPLRDRDPARASGIRDRPGAGRDEVELPGRERRASTDVGGLRSRERARLDSRPRSRRDERPQADELRDGRRDAPPARERARRDRGRVRAGRDAVPRRVVSGRLAVLLLRHADRRASRVK